MRPRGVDADAIDLSTQRGEFGESLSELGKLVRSTRAEVEGVRQQQYWAALEDRGQPHGFFAAHGELEVWHGGANSQGIHGGGMLLVGPDGRR
jgi:hypothetical protein